MATIALPGRVRAVIAGACGLILWAAAAPSSSSASDVVAVLSAETGAYRQALEGFRAAFGSAVDVVVIPPSGRPVLPKEARVVVAFGGRAALLSYPSHVTLIYCLAPGVDVDRGGRRGPVVRVDMLPGPDVIAAALKKIQPSLRRLGVLWHSDLHDKNLQDMRAVLAAQGIDVVLEKISSRDHLPERLRALKDAVGALWIPPDPELVNTESFVILKEFSWANDIPFYAPTAGLTELGAAASISCSFHEIGRTAAVAAKQALAGAAPKQVRPQTVDITVNAAAAEQSGLAVPRGLPPRISVEKP